MRVDAFAAPHRGHPPDAETAAATLQRRFDQLTDLAAHTLIAADLLAWRRSERVSTAGA